MSAPDVTMPQQTQDQSALASVVAGNAPPQMPNPQSPGSPDEQRISALEEGPSSNGAGRGSRFLSTLASIVSAGMAGIPDKGRSSFVTGLGEGARSERAAQNLQQDIKFKDFDTQVRAANLHHQDQELQMRTQDQQDAHQKFQDWQHDWNQDHGIDDTIVPNTGDAVVDHLKAQTAGNGAASIPAGTHLSADGNSIHVPTDTQETRDGQLKQYNTFGPAFGLPSLPQGAVFVPPRLLDVLTHSMQGYGLDGTPLNHDVIPQKIAALQSQRDQLAKKGNATPDTLTGLDNTIGILKANLKALDDHAAGVFAKQTQQKATQEGAVAGARAKAELPYKQALQDNAAADKPKGDATELNSVAFDPNYQNPDGSKGGNVVMSKADAQAKGLQHYKADAGKVNSLVAGFNDVQNKINQLADVAANPDRMSQVQGPTAAVLLKHGFGLEVGAFGTKVDLSNINTATYEAQLKFANQATRDYVTAMGAAHEAITQLPRLQTFGQSSRMTQQQMEAAQKMLPAPGDDAPMARQKMQALQTTIDPLRKQVPHMPGAESMPSWLEKQGQQRRTAPSQSNLGRIAGSPIDFVNSLQPR